MSQPALFEHDFRTARPARPVFCHQEFLDKLSARRNDPIGKRTSLLMQRMAVDIARLHYKATSGVNRGWRRSRLGGRSGAHFYAWWAPAGAVPLKTHSSFDGAAEDAVFLRDIRHHDDHAPLAPGSFSDDYLSLNVADLRATAGNLYSTTSGCASFGTVFELSPSGGAYTEKIIHYFLNMSAGEYPGPVVFDSAANLYGTTSQGGEFGFGTIFKLTPNGNGGWAESAVHNFTGNGDGAYPMYGVTIGSDGNVYGTTPYGGSAATYDGFGVVFRYKP